eukprot:6464780-Prymnesium_polylepis.1
MQSAIRTHRAYPSHILATVRAATLGHRRGWTTFPQRSSNRLSVERPGRQPSDLHSNPRPDPATRMANAVEPAS